MTWAARSVLCAALFFSGAALGNDAACDRWPQWRQFKQLYVSDDGRVVDASTQSITVSEGQAYALLFALIANDPQGFRKILRWTEDNLAAGDLSKALPAWKWGKAQDGAWRVLDRNSASDADLWMVYALDEAGKLWQAPQYPKVAQALSDLILAEETAVVPGLGPTLLPGPKGFVAQSSWRLNASYAPLQILREIAAAKRGEVWPALIDSSFKVIAGSSPHGFAADWIGYRDADGFVTDPETGSIGSYNAIRVYLWAGMLAEGDPHADKLTAVLKPMAEAALRAVPERIDTRTLEMRGKAPLGFSAALLPLMTHFKMSAAAQSIRRSVESSALKDNQHYYSDVLSLFGLGWQEQRYRFDRQGRLHPEWSEPCREP
jgi:endoglucanase